LIVAHFGENIDRDIAVIGRNNYTVSQKRDPNIIDCNFGND